MRGSVFDHAGNTLANDRAHRRGEKAKVHHGNGDLVTFDQGVAAENGIDEASRFLILAEPILVARHALKLQGINRRKLAVEFNETVRIAKIGDSLLRREREVIVASRADAIALV